MSNVTNTSDNSAHQAVRFQDAQAMYYQGQLERQRNAAGIGTFTMQSPPNFHKPTSSKIGLHDMLWKNWQTRQQQHFTNGMSFKNGSRSMPTSRSEQKWRAQAKNPRHKIPAEGLQYANHEELRAHFSGRQLADLASTNKIKRMQGKVGKVEEKITELVSKLNKHSERVVAGKLPAK